MVHFAPARFWIARGNVPHRAPTGPPHFALECVRDADIDPREPSAIGGLANNAANDFTPATVLEVKDGAASVNLEKTAPMSKFCRPPA